VVGFFTTPALDKLIEEALAHNTDLLAAAARVTEAEAQFGITRADQFSLAIRDRRTGAQPFFAGRRQLSARHSAGIDQQQGGAQSFLRSGFLGQSTAAPARRAARPT